MVVARLRAGAGQGLAPVIGQEQGRGGADFFAALVADGFPPVFGGRVAAVELDAGTVEVGPVFAQHIEPDPLPGPALAPSIKAGVHALPGQRCAREKLFNR